MHSIRSGILLITIGCILFTGVISAMAIQAVTRSSLERRMIEDVQVELGYLADDLVEPVLARNSLELQEQVLRVVEGNSNVRYVFVLSHEGDVLGSSFVGGVPPDLLTAHRVSSGTAPSVRRIESERETLLDVAKGILDGRAGEVHVGVREHAITEVVQQSVHTLLAILGAALGITILAVFLLSEILVRPIRQLLGVVREVARGNLSARSGVASRDEIGALAIAFDGMLDDLDRSQREIVEMAGRAQAIISSIPNAIFVTDPSGHILSTNPAAATLTGRTESDLVGQDISKLLVDPGRRPMEHLGSNLLKDRVTLSYDMSLLRRDGETLPVAFNAAPMVQADGHFRVLITGESGTGKELVARAIHLAGDRSAEPFVAVACGAVPDTLLESELFGHEKGSFTGATHRRIGKFEEAGRGTLFLDEIGELSPMAQVKFLRVLQEREYQRVGGTATMRLEARLVSATNRSLEEAIETGEFRQDLLYRINTVHVDLPPLRSRSGDVPLLAEHFLHESAAHYKKTEPTSITPEVMVILQRYSWPGNVRELKGVLEQATILCTGRAIAVSDLPEHFARPTEPAEAPQGTFHEQMDDHGRRVIRAALEQSGGVKRDAAASLGLSQRAISHYLKKYGIQ